MRRARRGRAATFSFGLVVGFLLVGYAALRLFELEPRSSPPALPGSLASDAPADREAWSARVTLGETTVEARLLPLHDEPALEEFRAAALRERYGLPAGRPWRLYLALVAEDAPSLALGSVHVDGLAPFAELARAPTGLDPVYALLAAAPHELEPGHARPLVLWGDGPSPEPVIELTNEAQRGTATLARAPADEQALAPRWYAGDAPPREEARSLEDEVARLQRELERERARRAEREQAFMEFSRMLGELPAAREARNDPDALAHASVPPSPEEERQQAAESAARARAAELGRSLGVLMRLEGLRGLDLLETGTLQAGPPPAMGPVVFRCLDERGLLTGSLRAERLRLTGSRAARTLTVILEDGFESRAGERLPFEDGARRITLDDVDPDPWFEQCPELFDEGELSRELDDGRWSLSEVRRELNRLLALDTRLGWYRLHSLGGVIGTELCDVQLEQLEPDGHVQRRLFADRLHLELEDASLVLELTDGAFVRGDEKQPFRDGRHRIVLPGISLDAWRAARLPGLSEPPEKKASQDPAPARR